MGREGGRERERERGREREGEREGERERGGRGRERERERAGLNTMCWYNPFNMVMRGCIGLKSFLKCFVLS